MKKRMYLAGLLMGIGLIFSACNNDNKKDYNAFAGKETVLLKKYPNAENITWRKSKDNKYDIATFTVARQVKADKNGNIVVVWFGTGDDIRLVNQEISFNILPAGVKNSFAKTRCNPVKGISDATLINTLYSDPQVWKIDDVYILERDGVVSYKIEAECVIAGKTGIEVDLYYDAQGILLKESEDTDDEDESPLEIPVIVKEWIVKSHKDADVVDYETEMEDEGIEHELDLKEGKIIIEVTLLENNGKLTVDELEYNYPDLNALPGDIMAKAKELLAALSNMTEEDIDEIEMIFDNGGNQVYKIELEKGDTEAVIEIVKDTEGKITGKIDNSDNSY